MSSPRRASAGVAVKQWKMPPKPLGAPIAFEDCEAIVPGVAAMDHDRELCRARLLELAAENALLHVARRLFLVVMVIEPHLAPRDHARVPGELVELREMLVGGGLRVVRVNADRRVDPIVLLGEGNRGVDALGRAGPAADRQQRLDARRAGALEHRRAVALEFRRLQVRMRINNFHGCRENSTGICASARVYLREKTEPKGALARPARCRISRGAAIVAWPGTRLQRSAGYGAPKP